MPGEKLCHNQVPGLSQDRQPGAQIKPDGYKMELGAIPEEPCCPAKQGAEAQTPS